MENVFNTTSVLPWLLKNTTSTSDSPPLESFLLYQLSQWIYDLVTPAILVFGTFGNVMTLLVLGRLRSGWTAMNVYLRVMAAIDLSVLYSSTLVKWLAITWDSDVRSVHSVVCKLLVWVPNTCAVYSTWLLVALTIDRAISVLWPHRVHEICTRRLSLITMFVLFLVISLAYSHVIYGFGLVTNGRFVFCTMDSKSYKKFMEDIFVQTSMVIGTIIPFVCLIFSNGIIIYYLVQSVKTAKDQFTTTHSSSMEKRKSKASAASLTLIAVSIAFIILKSPISIKNIIFSLYNTNVAGTLQPDYIALRHFVNAVVYMLMYLNYAINFYLYCLTGTKFRSELKKMLCFRWSSDVSHTANIDVDRHKNTKNQPNTENEDF